MFRVRRHAGSLLFRSLPVTNNDNASLFVIFNAIIKRERQVYLQYIILPTSPEWMSQHARC